MHRILIVDDSATIRKMVRASLRDVAPSEFVEVGTGLEAIEHLALAPVGLIVLDLNMPDLHGLDVLKFVRSQDRYKGLPIIVLTTRGDEASRRAAESAGASAYLTKPFAPATLSSKVKSLLAVEAGEIESR